MGLRVSSGVAPVALLLATSVSAQTTPFDGTWNVIFTCPAAGDGVAGYTRRFLAGVQHCILYGEIGVQGQAGYLAFDGSIQPNGKAILVGQGMTGNPDYVVGHLRLATPYSFHLQVSFAGSHGTGRRVETRACEAVFSRQ